MTVILNGPSSWPLISSTVLLSYWSVAGSAVVLYDWVLTLGQEIELIWNQRWSLMTVLYLIIRYIGIPFSVVSSLPSITMISLTDVVSNILIYTINGTNVIIPAMLSVIMIARLHAMYQGSRMMLIFLVVIFLVVNIVCAVIMAIVLEHSVGEELIASGAYMCDFQYGGDVQLLIGMIWAFNSGWQVLTLCLSIWAAAKYFYNFRRLGLSTGSTIRDCFRVLIKSHVLYFASFVCVSCLQSGLLSPELENSTSTGAQILYGALQILVDVQMFVLGPRLILSVRGYHAQLVANSDAATSMNSIVFQERVYVPTSSIV
ncbi:hypothetical protein BD769DRAFT_784957 [Suillus cothurnatus]|nr:hypothetical protein BD769DRAFT_784957 [Suillus cothurnatus]